MKHYFPIIPNTKHCLSEKHRKWTKCAFYTVGTEFIVKIIIPRVRNRGINTVAIPSRKNFIIILKFNDRKGTTARSTLYYAAVV